MSNIKAGNKRKYSIGYDSPMESSSHADVFYMSTMLKRRSLNKKQNKAKQRDKEEGKQVEGKGK